MEFFIDFSMVRKIVAHEYAQAFADIGTGGAIHALRRSQRRHDERLAAAADAPTLACQAGCSWCCHFTVDVRSVEVFNILDFVEKKFSAQEQARIRGEIAANISVLEPLNELERTQRNIRCPFLSVGRCSIYAVRPQTCRNYHATDQAGCQQSFEEPDNADIDPQYAPLVYQAGGAHVDAFSKALSEAGYDTAAFEMNIALATGMAQKEAAQQRFEAREPPFSGLQGVEVPLEFTELDE